MLRLKKKHPLAIRWFHWINLPLIALMVWSGILIYWARPVYRVGIGAHTLVKMTVAQHLYQTLHINNRLAQGMAWHFFFMWFFVINGVAYVAYTIVSGEWRHLVPGRGAFREAFQVVLHDLHLSKKAPPERKFNAAQQFAYTGVILMGIGSLVTGLAIYKPVQLQWLATLLGGYQMARFFHFWLTMGYVAFFLLHITQVARAGWNNFRAMITGYEIATDQPTIGENDAERS